MKKLLFVSLLSIGTLVVAEDYSPKVEKASGIIGQAQRGFKDYASGNSRNQDALDRAGVGGGGGAGAISPGGTLDGIPGGMITTVRMKN